MQATLIVGGLLALATSAVYVYVGLQLRRRVVEGPAQLAQSMFLLWWFALGVSTFVGGVQTLVYSAGALSIPLYAVLQQFNLLLIIAALLGLLFYLMYLYTGSKRGLAPLIAFYTLLWGYILWAWQVTPIAELADDGWSVVASPEPLSGFALLAVLLGIVGPQIGAAIALVFLVRKVESSTQKYRLGLVSTAILVWFGSALVASGTGLSEFSWWPLASRIIGLTAAGATLAAYRPPMFIRKKYGIAAVGETG